MFNFLKKKQFQFPGACFPSPIDKRDVLSSEIIPEIKRIPEEVPCAFDLEVLNQNGYPACVGFAGAGMKQYLEAKERINKIFDGLWLYQECKKIDGIPDQPGTFLRAVLKILQTKGAKPVGEPESEAEKYKIGGYAKVDPLTFEEIRKVIAVYNVCLMGFTGSNQGWQTAYVRPPRTGERTWGHAIFSESYIKDFNKFQNSWSEGWGDKGKGYYDKNYLPFEAWIVLIDYPTDLLSVPPLEGWVALPFLKPSIIIGNQVYLSTALNLRDAPLGKTLATLPKGQKCVIISEEVIMAGGYSRVKVRVK